MKNIYQNPYRIIGILSNATAREIQARKTKIQAFTRVGKPIDSEYDFNFLEDITRDETSITKAFSDIEQNIGKVRHSLFWFINYSSFDQMALEHLKNGDTSKAKEIWHKLTNEQEINAKNFSAYSNIATLWLLSEEEMSKVSGIQYKIKLIESGYFTDFVHLVADKTYNIDKNKQIEIFIDEVLKGKNISSQSLIQQLSGYAKTYLTQKATEEPVYSIETAVESCEEKRRKDKSNTYKYAKELYTNIQKPLAELKNILGIQDLKYQTMADSVAKELKQCAVDNWNNSEEETDLKKSIELVTLANKIATGKTLKEDIQKDIKTLEGMKDRELNKAIEVLEMIKKAYHKVPYGSTLNWYKVTDLITKHIPTHYISKIKNSTNTAKLEEYKTLVEFIISRADYAWKLAYLRYWSQASNVSSNPKPSPKTKLEKEHTKQDIKPRTKLITEGEANVASWGALIITILLFIAGFIVGKNILDIVSLISALLFFGPFIFGIITLSLSYVFIGIIILLKLIWKNIKTIKKHDNIWRKVVLIGIIIGIILFIILKTCHSTKETDYSDTESSYQTEQEITPTIDEEDEEYEE